MWRRWMTAMMILATAAFGACDSGGDGDGGCGAAVSSFLQVIFSEFFFKVLKGLFRIVEDLEEVDDLADDDVVEDLEEVDELSEIMILIKLGFEFCKQMPPP